MPSIIIDTAMGKPTNPKNGTKRSGEKAVLRVQTISPLGQRLREISDRALAAGTVRLSHDQIEKMIAEIRSGSVRGYP